MELYSFVRQETADMSVAGPVDQSPIYAEIKSAGHEGPDFVFVKK